ncbi:hypothetical protein [Azospirillum sp. ST 5-10]|uniref:hypothetical protein n=1 Tax=unclassified Azospirillum TaxID=2630922 RepID=UPI003F49F8A9
MFVELFSLICVAFAACGMLLIAARTLRLRLPRYAVPLVAAAAMIAFTVWLRYTWAERTVAGLPEGSVVLAELPYDGFLEPWTALFPRTGGLLVLDTAATLRNPAHPGIVVVTTRLLEEHREPLALQRFVDCAGRRHAPASDALGPDGLPPESAWLADGAPAALFDAACRTGT